MVLAAMARITVFGAGAMGTALAMHLARKGEDVALRAGSGGVGSNGTHPASGK